MKNLLLLSFNFLLWNICILSSDNMISQSEHSIKMNKQINQINSPRNKYFLPSPPQKKNLGQNFKEMLGDNHFTEESVEQPSLSEKIIYKSPRAHRMLKKMTKKIIEGKSNFYMDKEDEAEYEQEKSDRVMVPPIKLHQDKKNTFIMHGYHSDPQEIIIEGGYGSITNMHSSHYIKGNSDSDKDEHKNINKMRFQLKNILSIFGKIQEKTDKIVKIDKKIDMMAEKINLHANKIENIENILIVVDTNIKNEKNKEFEDNTAQIEAIVKENNNSLLENVKIQFANVTSFIETNIKRVLFTIATVSGTAAIGSWISTALNANNTGNGGT